MTRTIARICSAAVLALGAGWAFAQSYPYKPVRLVTAGVGSSADFVGRAIAAPLSRALGQQVIVDNRPGRVVIPVELVTKALPDGYTLLLHGSAVWLLPYLQDAVPYDPVKDLAPITIAINPPAILVVHPSVPANSVKDLVAFAKSRPGELNYATNGTANITHLAAELFRMTGGINIVRINYKAVSTALTELISGQVQLTFATPAAVAPHIKAARLRALAVTSAQPSALAPGLPTVAATLPGYGEVAAVQGFLAPTKTPAAIVSRLNQEIVRILNTEEVRDAFLAYGVEAASSSPQAFAAKIKFEMAKWGKVIKAAGIREE